CGGEAAGTPGKLLAINRRRCPNLIAHFLNADLAYSVQQRNYVAMDRHHFGADRDFYVWVLLMQLIEARQNLIVRHILAVKENGVSRRDTNRDEILDLIWRRHALRGQIDLDPLHMGLAQAHHHEA